jgi:hypothetical protein
MENREQTEKRKQTQFEILFKAMVCQGTINEKIHTIIEPPVSSFDFSFVVGLFFHQKNFTTFCSSNAPTNNQKSKM